MPRRKKSAAKKSFLKKEVDLRIVLLLTIGLSASLIVLVLLLAESGVPSLSEFNLGVFEKPPAVSVSYSPTSPVTNEPVTFTATAASNNQLAQITLYVNGKIAKTCGTGMKTGTCVYTTTFSKGDQHTYKATALDYKGKIGKYPRSGENTLTVPESKIVEGQVLYKLIISKSGGTGLVTSVPAGVNCGPFCTVNFYSGAFVSLRAVPDGDFVFGHWEGGCSGTESTCLVTMNTNKVITAVFVPIP
ncbi:TPA: Ig-like domain-containing protein [archaeon]|nr:Ig-like domain-containing protein [Candidatus Naiadarchaeales archaeon SRR2090153.bin461]HIK02405.1 Ig-like domain-containing protein [Candidatus Naiadarchaeales archaeon SRR2090159.bin1288]